MTRILPSSKRRVSFKVLFAALVVALLALIPSAASALTHPSVPAPPAHPTSADQIQNIDQVKTAIKAYYGDTTSAVLDPVNGTTALHFASPTSAYAKELKGIESSVKVYLKDAVPTHKGTKAVVFDIDDTTLNTYSYEIYSGFVFNPTTNAAFVNSGIFPAVFGMPDVVAAAQADGYTVFFLTGRGIAQTDGTVANLTNVGYPALPAAQYYLKDQTAPWLSSCAPTCSTIQYKSLTRAHIQSLGYDIVANLGDQFSDLNGGHADKTFKIPNPMYFLP